MIDFGHGFKFDLAYYMNMSVNESRLRPFETFIEFQKGIGELRAMITEAEHKLIDKKEEFRDCETDLRMLMSSKSEDNPLKKRGAKLTQANINAAVENDENWKTHHRDVKKMEVDIDYMKGVLFQMINTGKFLGSALEQRHLFENLPMVSDEDLEERLNDLATDL